jgi:hypothetical protein
VAQVFNTALTFIIGLFIQRLRVPVRRTVDAPEMVAEADN